MSGHLTKTIVGALLSTNLITVGAGAALLASGAGGLARAAVKPPLSPEAILLQRRREKDLSGQAGREGSGQTLLTGQTGVAGQPSVGRPTLLGG